MTVISADLCGSIVPEVRSGTQTISYTAPLSLTNIPPTSPLETTCKIAIKQMYDAP